MKTMRLLENHIGRTNLSNEQELIVHLDIIENSKVVTRNNIPCRIQFYYSDENMDLVRDQISEEYNGLYLTTIIDLATDFAHRVWFSQNFKGELYAFLEEFFENQVEIERNFWLDKINKLEEKKAEIQYKIDVCENHVYLIDNREEEEYKLENSRYEATRPLQKEVDKLTNWLEKTKLELDEYVETSQKRKEVQKKIDEYNSQINKLKEVIGNAN